MKIMFRLQKISFAIISLLFISTLQAQKVVESRTQKIEREKIEKLFAEENPIFLNKNYSDKYKNESGVILSQKIEYTHFVDGKKHIIVEKTRKRILLLDKAIVEEYSIFYFNKAADYRDYNKSINIPFAIRIEKQNGLRKIIDLKDAVTLELPNNEVQYAGNNINAPSQQHKIAIPNLQVGDIVETISEYSILCGESFLNVEFEFPCLTKVLNEQLPIAKQLIVYKVPEDYFINFNGINGAPKKLKIDKDSKNSSLNNYSFTSENDDKIANEQYLFNQRVYKNVHFQAVRAAKLALIKSAPLFIVGEPNVPINAIPKEKIASLVYEIIKGERIFFQHQDYYSRFKAEFKTVARNIPISDTARYIRVAYNFYRNKVTIEDRALDNYGNMISDMAFVNLMIDVLKDRAIDFEIHFAPDNSQFKLNEVASFSLLSWLIKANGKWMANFNYGGNFGDIPYQFSGSESYMVNLDRKRKNTTCEIGKIPMLNFTNSMQNAISTCKVSDADWNMNVVRTSKINGSCKEQYAGYALANYDHSKRDFSLYNGRKPNEEESEVGRNKHRLSEGNRIKQDKAAQDAKTQNDLMSKLLIANGIKTEKYVNFNLIQPGNDDLNPELIFSDEYIANNSFRKIGPDYLLSLESLIETQETFIENERKRKNPVFLNFPNIYAIEINIKVPSGYKPIIPQDFNKIIDNALFGFEASAIEVDNELKIKLKQIYKRDFYTLEEWPDYLDFADLMLDYTHKKLVFKKL